MKRYMKPLWAPVLVIVLIVGSGWGFLVHRTIHQLAIYELPEPVRPFFYKNMANLVQNAPRPDQRRNEDSTEATKHFIDFEMYGDDAAHKMPMDWQKAIKQYSKDSLLKYGYVPYHIIYMQGKLTRAFKMKHKDSILFYAADLGHYIGDAHVPLHTTVNYDGQLTNQKGLHSLWESMIPEIEIGNYHLYSSHQAVYLKDPAAAIWKVVRTSFDMVPEMLAKEKEVSKTFTEERKYRVQIRRGVESKSYTSEFAKAYAASLKTSINDRLLQAADMIADFWYTAWVNAGKPDLKSIGGELTDSEKKQLETELSAFKKNELIQQQLLLSKKQTSNSNN
jgi:hypothetical protein